MVPVTGYIPCDAWGKRMFAQPRWILTGVPVGTSCWGAGFWPMTCFDFGPVTLPSLQPARLISALALASVLPLSFGTVQVVIAAVQDASLLSSGVSVTRVRDSGPVALI